MSLHPSCALAITAALALLVSACGTTKVSDRVTRAPTISLKGHKTVSIAVQAKCTSTVAGPEMVKVTRGIGIGGGGGGKVGPGSASASIGIGLSQTTLEPKAEVSSCADDSLFTGYVGMLKQHISAGLRQAGVQVVPAGGDTQLVLNIDADKTRSIRPRGPMTDPGPKGQCAKACGSPTCIQYSRMGKFDVGVSLTGPSFRGIKQAAQDASAFSALKFSPLQDRDGSQGIAGCDEDHARRLLNDPAQYDWGKVAQKLTKWTAKWLAPVFTSHHEEFDVEFLSVDDSPACDRGIEAAEKKDWAGARAAFEAGLAAIPEDAKSLERRARALHNIAAALMSQRRLAEAETRAKEARKLVKNSDTDELLGEIKRRQFDIERM